MTPLRTEADVLRELSGCVTMEDIYRAVSDEADIAREMGLSPVGDKHGTDLVWRRRARSALQALRRQGRARRIGKSTWLLNNTRAERATIFLLISADAELRYVELRVADACDL